MHVTVAPVDTAQYRSPRSPTLEISSGVCVCMEKKNEGMEKKDDGRMNTESTELESPSAGTGLETPGQQCGQQCPPNGETKPTAANGCSLVGVGSNLGKHFFTHGTRLIASRYSYDTGKLIKNRFPKGEPQTR